MTTETKAQYTSGPWLSIRQVVYASVLALTDPMPIASTSKTFVPAAEAEANARLIAAAPELLEACRVAYAALPDDVRLASDWHAVAIALESAIAHATGETA